MDVLTRSEVELLEKEQMCKDTDGDSVYLTADEAFVLMNLIGAIVIGVGNIAVV